MVLSGKRALVTGAARGIGRAIALALAEAGADVVINYRSSAQAASDVVAAIEAMGRRAVAVAGDVSVEDDVKALLAATDQALGGLDILVNNAGLVRDKYLNYMTLGEWDEVIDVNLKGSFLCSKHAVRALCKSPAGRIINVSSVAGLRGDALRANYSAAKAGVIGLTKATARELAKRGVTANAIAPGIIETEMTESMPAPRRETMLSQIPLGRFGNPNEVAGLVVFLATDVAAYITGQVFVVDGGLSA
ncbi:MAG: 3-oxoacyl-ACP reductase FabG [Armatimonadetes bacterium]|nr:3-oxoacyl-ACP reductase FabG [Armatimonadota bacterium]